MPLTATKDVADLLIEALLPKLQQRMGFKGATGTPTTIYAHGPGGLFSTAGVEQDVISTVVQPTGIIDLLPALPSNDMYPLYQYLTGFLDDTGDDPDTVCENCVTAGVKKGCLQTAQFGRYCRETKELSIERVAERVNRSEPFDLRLLNPVFTTNKLLPADTNQSPFRSEMAQALLEMGVSFMRVLARQVWNGNPANNNVGGGYQEFPGLSILVGTNKIDALTGAECPSLDSDVKNFAYQDVCDIAPSNIVEVLTYMYRYVSKNARTMAFDPVQFAWVMREELFYELTSCWPCSYISFRCSSNPDGNNQMNMVEASEGIRMRDAMRNGLYLLVDGKQIPVILDDGIDEETAADNAALNPGEFASDIYLLPLTIRAGYPATFFQYFDFTKAQIDIDLARMNQIYRVTDAGKYLWMPSWVQGCFLLKAVIRPRLVLLTPHLAGRLQNVKYEPLQHTRQPFPDDGYFVDGGETYRSTPSYYSDWNLRQ